MPRGRIYGLATGRRLVMSTNPRDHRLHRRMNTRYGTVNDCSPHPNNRSTIKTKPKPNIPSERIINVDHPNNRPNTELSEIVSQGLLVFTRVCTVILSVGSTHPPDSFSERSLEWP